MREQRAFAAVRPDGEIDARTIRSNETEVIAAVMALFLSWRDRENTGWRIRPVLIRIEDNGGGDVE